MNLAEANELGLNQQGHSKWLTTSSRRKMKRFYENETTEDISVIPTNVLQK